MFFSFFVCLIYSFINWYVGLFDVLLFIRLVLWFADRLVNCLCGWMADGLFDSLVL